MIFSSSKCPLPALVAWCRALKHSLGAGLDPVKIFRQQAKSGPRPLRWVAKDLSEKLEQGESIADALEPHRDKFPPLFLELIAVGEQTGRLEDTFGELERYYETTLRVQRDFRSQMIYPTVQYVAAVGILAGMIFILDMLGSKLDPLGVGLTGTTGALLILVIGFTPGILLLLGLKKAANSVGWRAKLEGYGLWVPAWGPALKTFALQRFCVALRMCTEAGLRAEKVLFFSFRATANAAFIRGQDSAVAAVKKGGEIAPALEGSGAPFPEEFLQSIQVAEETGEMSEVTARLAENYREDGSRQLKQAAQFTSYAIYGMVALVLIFLIFRIAMTAYINPINEATRGM